MIREAEVLNAKILEPFIRFGEPNGLFTVGLTVQYKGLLSRSIGAGTTLNATMAGLLIPAIMYVVGVDEWQNLKDKYLRVVMLDDKVIAIKHITKDIELNFEQFYKSVNSEYTNTVSLFYDNIPDLLANRGLIKRGDNNEYVV